MTITNEAPLRVALYARYSSDMQNPKSVDDQFRECRKYADRQGWTIVAEFSDSGLSGALRDRPGYTDLLAAVAARKFDVVLFENIDRLGRDIERVSAFYKAATHAEIELHQPGRGKLGILDIGIMSTFAAFFLENLSYTTRRGIAGKVAAGGSGGGLSYGYKVATCDRGDTVVGQLEVRDEQAAIVRRIFKEYAAGRSPMQIAADLNAAGIPAPRGRGEGSGHWKQNSINGNRQRGTGILNNELYNGRRVWNRQRFSKHPETGKRVSRTNPATDWVINPMPALQIIDDALWGAVKRRQEGQSKVRAATQSTDRNGLSVAQSMRRRKYLLSGLLSCEHCGGKLTIAGTGTRKRYYCANAKEKGPAVCAGMPGIKEIDAATSILSGLKYGLMQDDAYEEFRRRFMDRMRELETTSGATLKMQDTAIREMEKVQGNLMRAVEAGQISDSIVDRLKAVDADLAAARTKRTESIPKPITLPDDLPVFYRAFVEDLAGTLTEGEVSGKASNELHDLVERVVVSWDGDLRVHHLEIRGKLVAMLQKAKPADAAGFVSNESSLKLVAGVGFEPTTFRL